MTFYKVKPQYNDKPGASYFTKHGYEGPHYTMKAGELLTQRELDLYRFPKAATEKVKVDKDKTFWYNACRYDLKDAREVKITHTYTETKLVPIFVKGA